MSKTKDFIEKIKNIPDTIYLNIGEAIDIIDDLDFRDFDQAVTWSEDKINEFDIEYKRIVKKECEKWRWKLRIIH